MEEMLNFARQAYLKHKVIEINYNMTQQIKDVKQEDIDKYVEKYKESVKHEFEELQTTNDTLSLKDEAEQKSECPTGTTEEAKNGGLITQAVELCGGTGTQ